MLLLLSIRDDAGEPVEISSWPRLPWDGGPEVRGLDEPTNDQIMIALALVASGGALSAAILQSPPPADRRWLAYEFRQAMVTDSSIDTGPLRALGWHPDPREGYTVWEPPNPERAWFAGGLFGTAPMTIEVSVEHDLADTALFGPLAASQQGGSSALMALSGARPGGERVLLRNPAALDLEVLSSTDSLPYLVSRQAVSVLAIGASAHTDVAELELAGFTDVEAARRVWQETERAGGFWLLIEVTALVDPLVGIPPGHIFEQRAVNGIQTLAAASSSSFEVGVNRPQTVVVPAWCLNADLLPPAGQPVRSTPLRARYVSGMAQQEVWHDRQRINAQ